MKPQFVLPVIALCTLGACSSGQRSPETPAAEYGAPEPGLAIGEFLDAAQIRDYTTMARLFGTTDGPAERRFGVDQVEQRMIVLASLLQHESYVLEETTLRQGGPDHRWFMVEMQGTRKGDVSVPMATARAKSDRWFVEQIDVNPLTGGP